ncbi:MAG: glycoside hydrolase family 97 N-terminal domain-containing protein, partial [Planctomycetes bacterium]|nr:glycoside hydrolase family 97 N-terminal domain-containing protein [Planctomycetota bacterium]
MRRVFSWLAFGSLICGGLFMGSDVLADNRWSLPSPDGRLNITLQLAATNPDANMPTTRGGQLTYAIDHDDGTSSCQVLLPSPLGIRRGDQSFTEDLRFVAAGEIVEIDDSYSLAHGKRRDCRSVARRQTFTFANASGSRLQVEFHAANDGVAFRYRFPEDDSTQRRVDSEATGFQLPPGSRAWIQPYQQPSMWTPAYEEYFADGIEAGTAAPTSAGWCLPALFHVAATDRWVLLAEAAVDENYCGCRLEQQAPQSLYKIRFPEPDDGNGTGDVRPASRLPWTTPWRVVLVSDHLETIVGSTLITDLNPPSRVADTSWIKPGRVAWSWWSDHDSPRDYESQCEFVDLAAEMGWEYVLVDANWTLMDGGNVRELADYARKRDVGLLLWYNSGGPHNSVTEKPRGCLADPHVRRFEYDLLNQWGIKGIKVDFFQSDKQNVMQLYLGILKDAAEAKIMINFHGCTV